MISTITRDELKKKIDRHENFLLLETLEPPNYEATHLPGAINLPPSRLQELAPKLAPKKDREIVVYCASPTCHASENAAKALAEMGYTNVKDYAEGKSDWMDAGFPTVKPGAKSASQQNKNP